MKKAGNASFYDRKSLVQQFVYFAKNVNFMSEVERLVARAFLRLLDRAEMNFFEILKIFKIFKFF